MSSQRQPSSVIFCIDPIDTLLLCQFLSSRRQILFLGLVNPINASALSSHLSAQRQCASQQDSKLKPSSSIQLAVFLFVNFNQHKADPFWACSQTSNRSSATIFCTATHIALIFACRFPAMHVALIFAHRFPNCYQSA